jgi:hypothetical protein
VYSVLWYHLSGSDDLEAAIRRFNSILKAQKEIQIADDLTSKYITYSWKPDYGTLGNLRSTFPTTLG